MNRILMAICSCVLLAGCKEKSPFIVGTSQVQLDSTYTVSPVPQPQPHNVLVEEFTGQSCRNCPAGHDLLETIAVAHPKRLNVIALYQNDESGLNIPPIGAAFDFRSNTAKDIAIYVTGTTIGTLPSAFIDRTGPSLERSVWVTTVDSRLAVDNSINLSVESNFDTVSGTATIKAILVYTKDVATKQNVSIVVVEDSMVDKHEVPKSLAYPDYINPSYLFTNVFRDMVTAVPAGDPVLDNMAEKKAGQAYWRKYTWKPKSVTPAIVPQHCRVIAFISSTTTGDTHILQSAQTKLVP
jgi:hypothetical protein